MKNKIKNYQSKELEQLEDIPQVIMKAGTCLWKATYANQTYDGLEMVQGTVVRRDAIHNHFDFIWGHHYWNVDADDTNVIVDDFTTINKFCAMNDLTPTMGTTVALNGTKWAEKGAFDILRTIQNRFGNSNINTIYVSGIAFNDGPNIYPQSRMEEMKNACKENIKNIIAGTHRLEIINFNNDVEIVPV